MIEFLTAEPNLPFAVALTLLLALFFVELFGFLFGSSLTNLLGDTPDLDFDLPDADIDIGIGVDTDADVGVATKFLYWLKIGRVPIIILIVVFMTAFILCGYGTQAVCLEFFGFLLPSYIAAFIAVVLSVPLVRLFGGGIAKIIPKDETAAITLDELVGLRAVVTIGAARQDSPAQARVTDRFGTTHYVMVEPERPEEELLSGAPLLLIRYNGRIFHAINHPEPELQPHAREGSPC